MTYPDGRMVSYTYDAMNRMVSVKDLDGETMQYAYDAAGRRIRTQSDSLTTVYEYDIVGSLVRQETSGASEIAFSYRRNKNGYITGEVREEHGETTESQYGYDALGQLTAFTQSTGYGERYAYDAAGNMLQKVITGTDGKTTALSMQYNAGDQLTSMAVGQDSIAYAYDANGSMIRKTLISAQYGTLTDTYTYDALDMLTGYAGYDGYTQQFTYDANGMRLSKREKGNASRSTLEELLRGSVAGLPEVIEPTSDIPEEYEWATTEYLYDITQEYYQVIRETRADNSGSTAAAYAYGLERVAAYTADSKTTYVYDGRGSVVQTMTAPIPGATAFSSLPDVSVKVQSFSYTAYGEQMGAVKFSGFTYNAEAFDAATGMLNLRARQYEAGIGRFSQKDIVSGSRYTPLSLNRYVFTYNSPAIYFDPSGESLIISAVVGTISAVVGLVSLAPKASAETNKSSTAYEYAKRAVEENDRKKQIGLAKEAFEYYKANYEDLPQHIKSAYEEAQKSLQYAKKVYKDSLDKYKIVENSIQVGLCKIIYGDQKAPDAIYDPSTIGNSNGNHYSSVPLQFQSAVAEKMQDEKAQYGQNGTSSIKYNTKNNEWILDCWGSEAVNAYLWMDKDVYELYKYSSIQGPVRRIYEVLDERELTYNINQNTGKDERDYWQTWLFECENGKSVDVPIPGVKGFVEYGKKSQAGYDHIFEVLPPGTYNGVTYERPIRTMANTKDNYQIVELYDYVTTVHRSGGYIAAWGEQPGTDVEKKGYVESAIYQIKHYAAVTTVGSLAVRGSYSKESPKKSTIGKNVTVTVLKEGYIDKNNEEWCQVRLQDGTVGYIMKKFLSAE